MEYSPLVLFQHYAAPNVGGDTEVTFQQAMSDDMKPGGEEGEEREKR